MLLNSSFRVTGKPDLTCHNNFQLLIDGMEVIDHEAPTSKRRRTTKSVLRLLDLEHAKSAVLNSLSSVDAQRGYRHAIDEFVDWYCSEPRLAFIELLFCGIGVIWNLVNSPQ